jgi:hypothetical protein
MLRKYLENSAKLRTDRSQDRYLEITSHRALHKPFLLLSVMDLIEPSYELGFGSDHDNNLKARRKNRRAAPSKDLKLHFQHQKEFSRTKPWEN